MSQKRKTTLAAARAVGRRRLGSPAPDVPVFPEITIEGDVLTIEGSNLLVGEA